MIKISAKKIRKALISLITILFIIINIMAYNHAFKFTHLKENDEKTYQEIIKPENLSFSGKLKTLFFGVQNFKSKITQYPIDTFETITINSNKKLEGWLIKSSKKNQKKIKGIVILFHGYRGNKSSLINYSNEFNQKGYITLLIDFMGSGHSGGNQTTIGFKESENVKSAFEYIQSTYQNKEIILFGHSMGAVAIMKSIVDYNLKPDKIIIQCPFGSMKKTVQQRFKAMGIPSFPLAELLIFYGGLQNGFNAFKHQPTAYAKKITVPSLLIYGEQDKRVTRNEIDLIYQNLAGKKEQLILNKSGHDDYLKESYEEWTKKVDAFIIEKQPAIK